MIRFFQLFYSENGKKSSPHKQSLMQDAVQQKDLPILPYSASKDSFVLKTVKKRNQTFTTFSTANALYLYLCIIQCVFFVRESTRLTLCDNGFAVFLQHDALSILNSCYLEHNSLSLLMIFSVFPVNHRNYLSMKRSAP